MSDSSIKLSVIFDMIKATKPNDLSFDAKAVQAQICEKLSVPESDYLLKKVNTFISYYKKHKKGKNFPLNKVVLHKNDLLIDLKPVIVPEADLISSTSLTPSVSHLNLSNSESESRKHVLELSERQQRRRFSNIVGAVNEFAQEEGITPTKVYAYGLKRKYNESKSVNAIGKRLFILYYGS